MTRSRLGALLFAGIVAAAAVAVGPIERDFEITSFVIAAGGGTISGGNFELTSTIGQATVGARLAGGDFSLVGGFWTAPGCPWDCDGSNDGNVNVNDLLALLGQWDIESPLNCTGGSCDYDNDGCTDVSDLLKLLAHYTTDPRGIGCP